MNRSGEVVSGGPVRSAPAPAPAGRPAEPQLKGVVWERTGDGLRVVYDRRDQFLIADPDGVVEALLGLLREGGRTVDAVARALSVGRDPMPVADVSAAVALLDEHGLLEDGARRGALPPAEAERHFSNLAFFESFASLSRSREDFHRTLRSAHVLVLGTGGLNSNTIPHLAGLGVGRLTLLDRDAVEARNFARQYLYRWSEIGMRKVDRAAAWVRAFDPTIEVEAIDVGIDGPEQLGELLDRLRPDVVASGIDHPDGVDLWVNAACVPRGVPFVRGGMWVTEGVVFSVDPGRSACLRCYFRPGTAAGLSEDATTVRAGLRLLSTRSRTNRGIGPVAGLLGALTAFEVLRYLTGLEPPAYAALPVTIDFAAGCATRQDEWARDPACPVCRPRTDHGVAAGDDGPRSATPGRG
jgi:molybdopterin/thiamine biosynthesis adenylyltransferase